MPATPAPGGADPETPGRRLILPEIAAKYGRSLHTVRKVWSQHPEWPPPLPGRRGRFKEYPANGVDHWVHGHALRAPVRLQPDRLYTAQELQEAGAGITAKTVRADVTRGRLPPPDDTAHGVKRWLGSTIMGALARRQVYHRKGR